MHSNNLGCFWQLLLFAVVILEKNIALGDLESFQPTAATMKTTSSPSAAVVDQIGDEANKQFVDFINSNVIETTSSGIKLQPPPIPTKAIPTKMGTSMQTAAKVTTATTKMGTKSSSVEAAKSSLSHLSPTAIETRTKDTTLSATASTTTRPSTDEFPLKVPTTTTTTITGTRTTLSIDYYYEYASSMATATTPTVTTIANDDATLLHPPSSDSLTKGFTIPTFLPPVREFAVADLPSYMTTTTTVSTTSVDDLLQNGEQFFFSPNGRRRNLTAQSTNVSVQVGNHAYLPCKIRHIQNKPVSWVRVRDGHILSVDQTTFIADQRFQSMYNEENEHSWSLQIKYVQLSDEGWYECQVSTEPKMSSKMYLEVIVPKTELIGDQNRFVKAGSKVMLHCIVRGTIVPPTYIIWYREKTQISEDNDVGWYTEIDRNIFGNNSDNENTIGSLIIPFVRKKDSGNFTCQPSNSEAVSVYLHVLSGEYSASAIMSAARIYRLDTLILLLIFFLLALQKT